MTDAVTILRAADPAADLAPDPAARARMDAAVKRLLASEPVAVPARTRRAWRVSRARALGAGAATAAVATGALFVALPGGGGTRAGVEVASAATVLREARAAALVPTGSGPWTAMTVRSWRNEPVARPDGGRGFALVPYTIESWASQDGEQLTRSTRGADIKFERPSDKAVYEAARRPSDPTDGKLVRLDSAAMRYSVDEVRALPTDPNALAAKLSAMFAGGVHYAASLLLSALPSAEQRAAIYAVLLRIPGARLEQGVTDPEGRTGDAVRFIAHDNTPGTEHPNGTYDTTLLFDRDTHALLGVRDLSELTGQQRESWDVVLDARRAQAAPKPDFELRLPDGSSRTGKRELVPVG